MAIRIVTELVDVNGSYKRMLREMPKTFRRMLATAVWDTADAVEVHMEADAPLGPEGEGLTPDEHIKLDIEQRGSRKRLYAQVGIFDDMDQVLVGVFNEYRPNRQPFMQTAARAEEASFVSRARRACQRAEQALAI
jgi:hypothetical protein